MICPLRLNRKQSLSFFLKKSMEKRKITVVCTTGNRTVEILSDATTLRELKSDLTREGISYKNMSFLEGLSKT